MASYSDVATPRQRRRRRRRWSIVQTESAEGARVAEGASAEGAIVAEGLATMPLVTVT